MCKICKRKEGTDDLIHLTHFYIKKYISRVILAKLQLRPLKLGKLMVLLETYYG